LRAAWSVTEPSLVTLWPRGKRRGITRTRIGKAQVARDFEAKLRQAGKPVEVFYYKVAGTMIFRE